MTWPNENWTKDIGPAPTLGDPYVVLLDGYLWLVKPNAKPLFIGRHNA